MGKKAQKPWTAGEKFMVFNFVTGGLCMLVTVVPHVPWRYALTQSSMTQRFGMDRKYSLLHIGDNLGMGMSWLKLRKDMCRKQQDFNKVSPLSGILGAAAGMSGAGGALVGCQAWPECKQHVSQRCTAYSTMGIVGIVCVLLQLISAGVSFALPVMLSKEAEFLKKKKKLDAAKTTTMICGIVAFLTGFFSWITWTVLSDMTFKGLAQKSAYPYPSAHIGIYLAGFGAFVFSIGFFQCLNRVYYLVGGKPEGDEDSDGAPEEYAVGAEPWFDDVGAEPQYDPGAAALLMPGEPLGQPNFAPQQAQG